MKKNYIFAALLMLLCGAGSAWADTYKVDFETTQDVSDHEFRVATGWSHIMDADINPYFTWLTSYVEYSYEAGAGVDGSQALKVGTQNLGYTAKYDLLVTPKVSGAVSIMVKASATNGEDASCISFYIVNDGVKGDEITPTAAPALTTDGYVKYELGEQDGVNIGIRGQFVYIDDFEAGSAEITKVKGLTVVSAKLGEDANATTEVDTSGWIPQQVTYINCDAEGKYTLSYDIELKNTGDLTLEPGAEGYTISIYDYDNGRDDIVIAENLPITEAIEPGTTATVNFKVENLTVENPTEMTTIYLAIRENVTNTEFGRGFANYIKVKYNAPEPQPEQALTITAAEATFETFTDAEGNTCVVADTDGNFTLSFNVTVKNTGTNAITAGTENYSIQMLDASGFGSSSIGEAVVIGVDLEPGQETVIPVSITLNRNSHQYGVTIRFRENITSTEFDTGKTFMPADDPSIEKRQLEITNVENKTQTRNEMSGFSYKTYTDTDADGNFTIEADVTVKNSGNRTLSNDDMLLTLYNNADESMVFATAQVGQDLEPGQSATVNLKAVLNIADYPNSITYYVKENISGNKEYVVSTQAFKKETTVEITIGEDGWATYSGDKNLSFANCEGLTAYVVTNVENGVAQLEEITEIPQYYGILLKGEPGTYKADIVDNAQAPEQNMLRASLYGTEVIENEYADAPYGSTYAFGKKDGEIGFVLASVGYTIPANKAYLLYANEAEGAREFIGFGDDTTTTIDSMQLNHTTGKAFNLKGQQVGATYKGIVVKNGKKYMVK